MPQASSERAGRWGRRSRADRAARSDVCSSWTTRRTCVSRPPPSSNRRATTWRPRRTGCEALEMTARGHYDLVLTDLRMDDMDGSTLLHELQQRHPSRRHHRAHGLRLHRVVHRRAPAGRLRLPRQALHDRRPEAHRPARARTPTAAAADHGAVEPGRRNLGRRALSPARRHARRPARGADVDGAAGRGAPRGRAGGAGGYHGGRGGRHLHGRAPHQHRPLGAPAGGRHDHHGRQRARRLRPRQARRRAGRHHDAPSSGRRPAARHESWCGRGRRSDPEPTPDARHPTPL